MKYELYLILTGITFAIATTSPPTISMSASPSKRQKLNKENESNINTQCECCQAFECLKSVKSGGDSTKPPVHDAYSNNPLATTSLTPEKLTKTYEVATKRTNAISWDDYFMSIAHLSALRSKDPSTQVGACIVNEEVRRNLFCFANPPRANTKNSASLRSALRLQQRIVGIGYNGFPAGCDDDKLPWSREAASDLDTKYPFVCHAEVSLTQSPLAFWKTSIFVIKCMKWQQT